VKRPNLISHYDTKALPVLEDEGNAATTNIARTNTAKRRWKGLLVSRSDRH
jgi:hypothetical protein